MVKFLDLNAQYQSIKNEMDSAISSVIAESAFIGGKYVKSFEEDFSQYVNSKFSIGVGNGTDALEIAIEAANLPQGSEIIVPANSFIASSEAVTRCGHKVVFVDVDPDTYILTDKQIAPYLTPNTSAIIAVHLYGHPCDMDGIMKLSELNNLIVIEDCAQAHGAEYKGKRVGTIGHFGTFSFYPGKNLGAYGDGGMITTQSEEYAIKCRMIANHGRIAKYDHEFEGRNSRLDGLQAAILSVKLKHIEAWTERRIEVADIYLRELQGTSGIELPIRKDWARQVYHLFVVRVEDREGLREFLSQRGIQSGIHYPKLLPSLSAYDYLNTKLDGFVCNRYQNEIVSLPIGEHLSDENVLEVVSAVKAFLEN